MTKYDPSKAPAPAEWNAESQEKQIQMIKAYHDMIGIPVPNLEKHATLHLIVESQIAMGDEIPVSKQVDRLLSEGADRHAVIHAIGNAFVHLQQKANEHPDIKTSPVSFFKEIEALEGAKLK
jgi:hypothetical protein